MTSVPSHVTPLRFVQPAAVDVARARLLLGDPSNDWLGTRVPATRPGSKRFLTDLALPIREHAPMLVFKKAAFVDVGAMTDIPGGSEIEIGWQSSSLAPLFPVFAGHLTMTANELRLEGYYAPPGGDFGAVLDKAFLSIAARGTARWFLGRIAELVTVDRAGATIRSAAQAG